MAVEDEVAPYQEPPIQQAEIVPLYDKTYLHADNLSLLRVTVKRMYGFFCRRTKHGNLS
jgi:hypothetical protein